MAIYRLLLFRWAPLIYLITALPAALFIVFLVPPFQMPDESVRFLQAAQLVGDGIPADAFRFTKALEPLAGHPDVKVDASVVVTMRTFSWDPAKATEAPPLDPDLGPSLFSAPMIVGLSLGHAFGLGLSDSYLAGRLVNAFAAVGLGTLAIGVALRGRAMLFVLSSLPMAVYLDGAATPDAMLTTSVALVVALCSRAAGRDQPLGAGWRVLMAVLIGSAVAAHPTYLPLLALLLTSAVRPARPRSTFGGLMAALGPFCLAVIVVLGGLALRGAATHLSAGALASVSLQAEADVLRHQLPAVWAALRDTVLQVGTEPGKALIGTLGGLDIPIPGLFFIAWLAALVMAAALGFVEEGETPSFGTGVAMLFCFMLAAVAISIAVSLGETPDRAGMPGRVLLPLTALLALAIPALIVPRRSRGDSGFGTVVALVGWPAIFGLAAVSDWLMLPPVLLNRFFL